MEKNLQKLNNEQRQAAQELLEQYSRVCAGKMDFGKCDLLKHRINLKEDAQPSVVAYKTMNATKLNIRKVLVDKLLTKELIELTQSEREAPIVLISKKEG